MKADLGRIMENIPLQIIGAQLSQKLKHLKHSLLSQTPSNPFPNLLTLLVLSVHLSAVLLCSCEWGTAVEFKGTKTRLTIISEAEDWKCL